MKNEAPRGRLAALSLAALGIVYGDIGTSPLYAFRESFLGGPPLESSEPHILGVLSLILWSATIVISLKYLMVVMRADNHGEGGIIALVSLLHARGAKGGSLRATLVIVGLFGAALLYGDGTITPAISVLSAIEGLEIATSAFDPYIVPITIAVLIGLFAIQKRGTASIGRLFGPMMLVWFGVLALMGLGGVIREPTVLRALNPYWAVQFLATEGVTGVLVLGSVFLVVTGGETLYADMGHFGPRPIRVAWYGFVMPSLFLNYLGQAALVLTDTSEIRHPFYHLAPDWALYPLVILATIATVIASQAVISGVFSLTRQAMDLDQLPRMHVVQTSEEEYGQIYIPTVNWMLMVATIALVVGFRSSSNLASAYGVAISTDMVITTMIALFIFRERGWSPLLLVALGLVFFATDLAFFGANLVKIPDGGWYPLVVGGAIFLIMTTWRKGRAILKARIEHERLPVAEFIDRLEEDKVLRVEGTAVFLTKAEEATTPPILKHQIDNIGALQRTVVFLHVEVEDRPRVPDADRLVVKSVANGIHFIHVRYGFMQRVHVPSVLETAATLISIADPDKVIYYLGRETLIPTDDPTGMRAWRDSLFVFLNRNAHRATTYFGIPSEQVVELGIQVQI